MSTTKTIMLAVVCLLSGLAAGWSLSGTEAKTTDIRWKYGSAELVINLEKDMADNETLMGKIFSKEYSAAGATNWLKFEHQLFHFTDPDLVEKLKELSYESPASRELRELRNKRVGPWTYQAQVVKVSIPEREVQPSSGYANVCESGIFFRKKIEVFLPDRPDKKITLQASGRYACPNGYKFPDIQLSREDAKKLFGYSDFSKYETAAAVVIQE
jgi:hypothetical protein